MATAEHRARRSFAKRRKALGFTQESLAARLDVERSTVVRWEAGKSEPRAWLWPKLAAALKMTSEQLTELLAEETKGSWPTIDKVGMPPHDLSGSTAISVPPKQSSKHIQNIDAGHATTMQSFRSADRKVGGGHLYSTVISYLQSDIAPRLFEGDCDADSRMVFTAAAGLTEMAG